MIRDSPSRRQFLDNLPQKPVVVDQWQLEKLALVMEKLDVLFYVPGLNAEYYSSLWGPAFACLPEAVAALTRDLPHNAKIAVIPDGPYVLAKVEEAVLQQ